MRPYPPLYMKLAADCRTWRLKEDEALVYFRKMTGKPRFSPSTLYRVYRQFDSDESVNAWMNEQARIGFVRTHRELIDEIDHIAEPLMRLYIEEANKPSTIPDPKDTNPDQSQRHRIRNPDKNKYLMLKLAAELRELNERKSQLNLGNPIIASIKQKIDQSENTGEPQEDDITSGISDGSRLHN